MDGTVLIDTAFVYAEADRLFVGESYICISGVFYTYSILNPNYFLQYLSHLIFVFVISSSQSSSLLHARYFTFQPLDFDGG
jgi:hypothetical protein